NDGVTIAKEIGDRWNEAVWLSNLGNACASIGDIRKAIEYYEQALAISREIGDRRGEGIVLWNMSLALDHLGERAQAIKCARSALKIIEPIGGPQAENVRRKLQEWVGQQETQ
ncbi:MAG TPA: tetratricopeptide repeat protein, partial [Methanothrix sp.]|nr:tetratricopeptide repeat protein [Methanothrix sp.]